MGAWGYSSSSEVPVWPGSVVDRACMTLQPARRWFLARRPLRRCPVLHGPVLLRSVGAYASLGGVIDWFGDDDLFVLAQTTGSLVITPSLKLFPMVLGVEGLPARRFGRRQHRLDC